MKAIKFRGKRIDNGEWVHGDLITGQGSKRGRFFILPQTMFYPKDCNSLDGYEVTTESVGQLTGLLDKNGKEIFEGDIVEYENGNAGYGRPRHEELSRDVVPELTKHDDYALSYWWSGGEIIGNVFEHIELLKEA